MPTQTEQIIALAESIAADIKLLANSKVDQITGKSLSTEDYTTPEKTKLAGLVPSDFPTLAVAATMDIGAINSRTISITATSGGVAITSLGTAPAGVTRTLVFTALGAGIKTMTHNATSLILPGAINLTVTAGTVVEVVSLGGGNWRATSVTKANGQAVAATPFTGGTLTTALNEATVQNIAAATTMDLTAVTTNTLLINSGSGTEISGLGTGLSGMKRTLVNLTGTLLFKGGSGLELPGGQDWPSNYGDVIEFVCRGNGTWTCVSFLAASGKILTSLIQVGTTGQQEAQVDIAGNIAGNPRSAPIKLHAGINMETPENGAFEYDGTTLYFTTGGVRKTISLV